MCIRDRVGGIEHALAVTSFAVQHSFEALRVKRLHLGGDVSFADCCPFVISIAFRVPVTSFGPFEERAPLGMIGRRLWQDNNSSRLVHAVAQIEISSR
eukprot:3836399-Amphidinium_carterae.1